MKKLLMAASFLLLGATNSYSQEYIEVVNQCARSISVARSNFGTYHKGVKNPHYVSSGWTRVESGRSKRFTYANKSYKGIRIGYYKNGESRYVNLRNQRGFDRTHRLCTSRKKFSVLDFYWATSPGLIDLQDDRHYSACDRLPDHHMQTYYVFRYGNRKLYITCGD